MARSHLLAACLLIAAASLARSDSDEEPAAPESARRVRELAARYEFFAGTEQREKLKLEDKPLLTYSNPVRGDVYGNVFVWTRHGRPEVVGAIFDFRSEDKFDSELHTLATGGIVALRDGAAFWNPERRGVEFHAVPAGPAPAASAPARLRQMRRLAADFTVERDHPEQGMGLMRLLPQPIWRYASPEAGVTDGAMFVFVEGTDPEAYLLLEAAEGEKPEWRFAMARMNVVEFQASYQGEPVWHVDAVSWDIVFDKHESYAIIRESPRRGLKRSR